MFYGAGFDHGRDDGVRDARNGDDHRPKPIMAMSLVSPTYLDAYLKGYSEAYRDQKQIEHRLDKEALLREERQRRLLEGRKGRDDLRRQNNYYEKEQGDLER